MAKEGGGETAVSPPPPPAKEIVTGVINGRYQLHNTLGQGGMGIVHRATDRLTGGVVALKQVTLSPSLLDFTDSKRLAPCRPVSSDNDTFQTPITQE